MLDYSNELKEKFYDKPESFYFERETNGLFKINSSEKIDKERAYRNNLYLIPLVLEPYNKGLTSCELLDWKTFGEEDSDNNKKKKDKLRKTIAEYAISENDENMMEMPSFPFSVWPSAHTDKVVSARFYDYASKKNGNISEPFCPKLLMKLFERRRTKSFGFIAVGLNNHNGTDIRAGAGTNIRAVFKGTISGHTNDGDRTGRDGTGSGGYAGFWSLWNRCDSV